MTEQATATALVLEAPRQLEPRSFPRPQIGDDDGLLRIEACGLCGTDHEQYTGLLHPGYPFVPGHESVGIIEQIGPVAAERWGVATGDRVAVEVFRMPPSREMYGFIPVATSPGLWGGYATHQYLAPDSQLLPVPAGLDPVVATLFNPLGAGIRWGVTVPGTRSGDVVAILGPGIRGLSALIAVKAAGAGFVMVTGRGEHDRPRLEWASRLGADLAVDTAVDDPVRAFRAATGEPGADAVIDVTAKAPAALGQAVRLARPGGTIVLAGTRGTEDTPGFHPDHVIYKELRIIGALGVDTTAYRAALDLLASGQYPLADLPRRIVGFDDLPHLIETMAGETGEVPPIHGVLVPPATVGKSG